MEHPDRPSPQADVTRLLVRANSGDQMATDELFPLVYNELRAISARFLSGERANHTLQPTALVHEAYFRLVGDENTSWENRAHFFGAASKAIRRILADHARTRNRVKRGGGASLAALESDGPATIDVDSPDFAELDDALTRLTALDPQKASMVELRFFAGLSVEQTALALGVSESTVARDWRFAKAWLKRELSDEQAGEHADEPHP